MTDGTEVDTGELRTFANGMDNRGKEISTASEDADTILSDRSAFGLLNIAFVDQLMESASRTVEGLMLLSKAVRADATSIRDAATTYDNVEQNQLHRFGGETRG